MQLVQNFESHSVSLQDKRVGQLTVTSYSSSIPSKLVLILLLLLVVSRPMIQLLAKTLTHSHPLAGRIEGYSVVECNDKGVVIKVLIANCWLSNILEHPNLGMLKQFLPMEIECQEAGTGQLLLVQPAPCKPTSLNVVEWKLG
ncbi:unnamed protein product [Malus baccata var. baccata]